MGIGIAILLVALAIGGVGVAQFPCYDCSLGGYLLILAAVMFLAGILLMIVGGLVGAARYAKTMPRAHPVLRETLITREVLIQCRNCGARYPQGIVRCLNCGGSL